MWTLNKGEEKCLKALKMWAMNTGEEKCLEALDVWCSRRTATITNGVDKLTNE